MLEYKLSQVISTMSYVEILIPDVNQDLDHADNFQ